MSFMSIWKSAFSGSEVSMWQRLAIRSMVLVFLTAAAMLSLDLLVLMARHREADWLERWPEIINILRAGFIMTWIELSILWIRACISPKVDTQVAMNKAAETPMGAAVISVVHFAHWALRFAIFLELSGLAK